MLAAIMASAVLTAMRDTMPGRCLRTCGVHMPKVVTAGGNAHVSLGDQLSIHEDSGNLTATDCHA